MQDLLGQQAPRHLHTKFTRMRLGSAHPAILLSSPSPRFHTWLFVVKLTDLSSLSKITLSDFSPSSPHSHPPQHVPAPVYIRESVSQSVSQSLRPFGSAHYHVAIVPVFAHRDSYTPCTQTHTHTRTLTHRAHTRTHRQSTYQNNKVPFSLRYPLLAVPRPLVPGIPYSAMIIETHLISVQTYNQKKKNT